MRAWWAGVVVRVRALVWRREFDDGVDEELRFHLDREVERNVVNGMAPEAAAAAARRALGNRTLAAEDARDTARWRPIEETRQDVAYALRSFRRAPTFVVGVVGTIGLGLGLLASAFTLFDAYVLRTMPIRDALSIYEVTWHSRDGAYHGFTWAQAAELAKPNEIFAGATALWMVNARLRNVPVVGDLVAGNYFDMLGVPPALGRTIVPEDARVPGSNAVIVLSFAAWKRLFGGDAGVIGTTVSIGDVSFTVVGVAREGFTGLGSIPLDFWVPATMSSAFGHPDFFRSLESDPFHIVARLPQGRSLDASKAALKAWLGRRTSDSSQLARTNSVDFVARGTALPRSRQIINLFAPILVAFLLVMLIACANVANLMLARGMSRQREMGIRLSLGADRRRLIRQLLNESLLLALPSAALGLLVSRLALEAGLRVLFATVPPAYVMYMRFVALDADWIVIAFMMIAAVVAAVVFGLLPALQTTRTSIIQASKGDFDSPSRRTLLSDGLAVVQVCLSVVLVVCAGVLLRAARDNAKADPGLVGRQVVQATISEKSRPRALDGLQNRRDVVELASAAYPPLDGTLPSVPIDLPGQTRIFSAVNSVSPNYFSVLGIPILDGRAFTRDEAMARVPVVIVSRAAASKFWPNRQAIGQQLGLAESSTVRGWVQPFRRTVVVGVVGDVVPGVIIAGKNRPLIYYPQPLVQSTAVVLARVVGDANRSARDIEHTLTDLDPGFATEVHTVESSRQLQAYPFTAAYWISSTVGAIALVLTITGIYGVLSYLVEQRRKELGIRSALGAGHAMIMTLVLSRGARLAVWGIALGVAVALALAKLLALRLFVDAFDANAYVGGSILVFVACLLAAYIPSRRAARVDPLDVLRFD